MNTEVVGLWKKLKQCRKEGCIVFLYASCKPCISVRCPALTSLQQVNPSQAPVLTQVLIAWAGRVLGNVVRSFSDHLKPHSTNSSNGLVKQPLWWVVALEQVTDLGLSLGHSIVGSSVTHQAGDGAHPTLHLFFPAVW